MRSCLLTTAAFSAALVAAVPAPQAPVSTNPSCPAANGTDYVSSDGKTYTIACDVDYYDNDLGVVSVNSFAQCIDTCSGLANCTTVVFVAPTACYPKTAQGYTTQKGTGSDYSAASLVSAVSSVTSSISTPQTTITTTNPPITTTLPPATTTISSSQPTATYPSCWTYCWTSYGVDSRSEACSSDQATQCIKQECSANDYDAYQAWLQNGCPHTSTSSASSTCPAPSTVTSVFTQSAPPASTITQFTTSQVNFTVIQPASTVTKYSTRTIDHAYNITITDVSTITRAGPTITTVQTSYVQTCTKSWIPSIWTATETVTAPCTSKSIPIATLTQTEYITATASKQPTTTVTVTISPSDAMPPPPPPPGPPGPTHPRPPPPPPTPGPPGPEHEHPDPHHDGSPKSCPKPNLKNCDPGNNDPWAWQVKNKKHSYSALTTCGVLPTGPWLADLQHKFDRAGGFGDCIHLGGQDRNVAAVAWDPNARRCKAYGAKGMRDQEGADWMQYAEVTHRD